MKKLFITVLFFSSLLIAQTPDSLQGWIPSAIIGANLSQVAFSNWAQGGDNTIAWTFLGNGGYGFFSDDWKFRNDLKLVYGRTKLGEDQYRTNDNEIYLETVVSRNIKKWIFDPYFSNTVRSTLAAGYNYKDTPYVRIADFFDPGYVTQSLGFIYDESDVFSSRLGIAVQEVFTNRFRQYSDDLETLNEVEAFKLETGIESVTNTEIPFWENMLFKSSLRLFTRFENLDVWDIRWDNAIAAKVNKYINVNFSWLVLYEKSLSPKTQLKEAIQIGITYILL